MLNIFGVEIARKQIIVTLHAKQRLYDRFPEMCIGRGHYNALVKDIVSSGHYLTGKEDNVKIITGEVVAICSLSHGKLLVKTIVKYDSCLHGDFSEFKKDARHDFINMQNRKGKECKPKSVKFNK